MFNKFSLGLLTLLGISFLAGCSSMKFQPIKEVRTDLSGNYTTAQVHDAILTATKARKWATKKEAGAIIATYNRQAYAATVRIEYTNKGYAIKYMKSDNLLNGKGNIHNQYGKWTNNLDSNIKGALGILNQ